MRLYSKYKRLCNVLKTLRISICVGVSTRSNGKRFPRAVLTNKNVVRPRKRTYWYVRITEHLKRPESSLCAFWGHMPISARCLIYRHLAVSKACKHTECVVCCLGFNVVTDVTKSVWSTWIGYNRVSAPNTGASERNERTTGNAHDIPTPRNADSEPRLAPFKAPGIRLIPV